MLPAKWSSTGAWARRMGEEGRGVATIIEMVQHTRLDCVIGSAALMRQALMQAIHHARHRKAFGSLLMDQPLMQNVLADLAHGVRSGHRVDDASGARFRRSGERFRPGERLARLGTAVGEILGMKRAPGMVNEALECLGGNGYVEECVMPRLYREAPLNSIWEGSGNVICLDILRAIKKEPEALASLLDEIRLARGVDRRLDTLMERLEESLRDAADELEARRLTERLALTLQASLLIRHSVPEVADAFCATRLGDAGGRAFGTLPRNADFSAILKRAFPAG